MVYCNPYKEEKAVPPTGQRAFPSALKGKAPRTLLVGGGTPEPLDLGPRTRQLRNLVEPIAAAVFFVPEAHYAYVRLGFPPPQGTEDGIPLFDWGAYFVSRAACIGQVHGAVVAAAFGVFEPTWV